VPKRAGLLAAEPGRTDLEDIMENVITTSPPRPRSRAVLAAAALLTGLGVVAGFAATGDAAVAGPKKPLGFDEASVRFVANRTDHDGQLFWSVTYEQRMADVAIHAPSGKLVATATFDEAGQADAHFDSPEPTVATLRRTYPAGRYAVTGHTTTGRPLSSIIVLKYRHVGTPIIVSPTANQTAVPTTGFVVRWDAVPGASSIHIQVESDTPSRALEIDLRGTSTSFAVPDGFLFAGTEYVVDVMARHPSGNYTLSDATFTTG
jgi:hypothetical protein